MALWREKEGWGRASLCGREVVFFGVENELLFNVIES
jgi:hypothetical protein